MTVSGRPQLSWNEFQQQHKGRGWSKQEMSEQWKAYKTSHATRKIQLGASIMHSWLQGLGPSKPLQHQSIGKDTASFQDAAADVYTPVKQQPKQQLQQLQTYPEASPAAAFGAVSISPITPSSCCSSQQQAHGSCSNNSSLIPAQELSALRTAVEHLLSGQQGLEQHLQSVLLQDSSSSEELQYPGAASAARSDALHACGSKQQQQQQHSPVGGAAVNCFGFASSVLSWNGFQKACKGLGMSKAELSAAWKHYKATGQLPGQLLQQQQQLAAEAAADWLPPVQQHSQQQQQQLLGKPAGSVKWASLKDWVQRTSRASSRAVSRVVSRVVSPAATPQPSPGGKARATRHHQQQQVSIEGHGAAAAAVAADGRCSIGGFVTATAAVAGASVPAGQWLELDREQYEAQQQAILEQQLQAAEEELKQQQQQHRHHSQQQGQWQWPNPATQTGPLLSSSSSSSGSSSSSQPPASSSSAAPPGKYAGAASQQHCSNRTARELVDHSCHGLLDGFGPWMPVSLQSGRLKRLKTDIPAKPGLYEWGVRLPVGTTAADLAAAAAAADGLAAVHAGGSSRSASSGVRTRSGAGGLQQVQPAAEYGPVICFYLGKAGELQRTCRFKQGVFQL
jgi:hypothetical protein